MDSSTTVEPQEKKSGWRQKTLKAAGYGYMTADILGVGTSLTRTGAGGSATGFAIWFAGGVAAARYGNPKPDKQLQLQALKIEQLMRKHGIEIPEDVRQHNTLLKKRSYLQKCEDFIYQHPSEVLNTMFGIGAIGMLKTGWAKRGKHDLLPKSFKLDSFKLSELEKLNSDLGIGICVLAGALSGLLIKEDPEAKKKAEHGTLLDKAVAFIREKPLRLTGFFYALNNAYAAIGFLGDRKRSAPHKGPIHPKFLSGPMASIYILSNVMMMLSSRDQTSETGFSPEAITKLEDTAARIIAAQPSGKQQALITDVANHLVKQKGVSRSADVLEQEINDRVYALTKKPEMVEQEKPASFAIKEEWRRSSTGPKIVTV